MRKRILSLLTVFAMIAALMPVIQVSAETVAEGYLTFDDSTGMITGCNTAASGEIIIPDKINGVSVKSIGDSAFRMCKDINRITLPESVASIGAEAFYGCSMLGNIDVPGSVKEIGEQAFAYCTRLKGIAVPEGVETIGKLTFQNCYQLADVTLPESLKRIEQRAFYGCWGITSISIPSGIAEIETGVFGDCQGLESVTLPDGLTSIGDTAFYKCEKLSGISIPAGVTEIGENAFRKCIGLTAIAIPDGVASINDGTFFDCLALETVTVPASVTVIGDSAFYGCGNIKRIIYGGTADQWSLINVASGNDILKKVYISYAGSSGGDGEAETRTLTNFESLRSGDRMIVSFDGSIYNSSEKAENIIIALYIGDVLSQTKIYRMDAGSYKNRLYDCEFYVGDAEDVSVKAFRWTDGDYVPIEDAAEIHQCPDKTVSFSCRAVPEDYDFTGSGNIPVFSSDDSATGTIQYDLADDAELYVNGVSAGAVTNDNIYGYIVLNPTGTVTLADAYDDETGEFDSKYDRVLVDRYIDDVVDFTAETSGYARVYFKWQETSAGIMEWDPSSDADITFIKDGKVISYKGINEDDVLSIKYNILDNGIGGSSLKELDYAEVFVSDKKVSGMVTAVDEDSQSVILNDELYYLNPNMVVTEYFETNTYYDLYLDAFGYVAGFTEYETLKNYGVLIWMDRKADTGDPYVWLINTDGELVQYMCASEAETDKFYNYIENGSENYTDRFGEMLNEDIRDKIIAGETVCTYTLDESNRISFDKAYWANGGSGLEYRSRTNRLSAYLLGENTRLLYLGDYMSGSGKPHTMSVSDFEDQAQYTAYLFDKNAEGVYRFGIVLE